MFLWVMGMPGCPALAGDIYRWTNPETGEKLTTPNPPPYPIKESRPNGRLPNGELIELILDPNAPEVKAKIEARKAKEAERQRIADEEQRQRAAREAEEQRQRAAREAEEQRQRAEREIEEQRQRAARDAAIKATVEANARERAAREAAFEQKIRQVGEKMVLARKQAQKDEDVDFMLKIIDEFSQQEKFASSTPRISLTIPINNLLSIKSKLDAYPFGSCYSGSKRILQEWMRETLDVYYDFSLRKEESSSAHRESAIDALMRFWLTFPESC